MKVLRARGREKRIRRNLRWVIFLMYKICKYWNLWDIWYSSKIFVNSSNLFFLIRIHMYQNIYLKILKTICSNISCITKISKPKCLNPFCEYLYIENISTLCHKNYKRKLDIAQNVLRGLSIFLSYFLCSKCTNTQNTPGGKMCKYPQLVHY